MANIQNMCSHHGPIGNFAPEFNAALSVYAQLVPQFLDSVCIEGLQQDLLIEMLYDNELVRGHTTLYQFHRECLVSGGFRYKMAPGSNRLIKGLARCFFTKKEDEQYAVSCLKNLRQPNSSNNAVSSNTDAHPINVIQQQKKSFEEKKETQNI